MQLADPDSAAESEESEAARAGFSVDLVWRCSECGYQRQSGERPARCVACSAPPDALVGKTSIEWRAELRRIA